MKHDPKTSHISTTMSVQELAQLGAEKIAYIRPISAREVLEKFSDVQGVEPGMKLWALFAANGDPLALADDPGDVLSNAHDLNLAPVSLH